MGLKKRSTQMTANTLSRATNVSVNLNGPVNEFRHLVMSWDDWQEGMDVVVRHLKQKDLPAFVFPEGEPFAPSTHPFAAPHRLLALAMAVDHPSPCMQLSYQRSTAHFAVTFWLKMVCPLLCIYLHVHA